MDYRKRFEETIKHHPVDRAPFDLAGTSLTGIENQASIKKLQQCLGFTQPYDGWYKKFDDRILRFFDIDIRRVGNILSPASVFDGQTTKNISVDCWGIKRTFTGLYWDIVEHPLKGTTISDLDSFPWPDPNRIDKTKIEEYRKQARKLYLETDYVICGEHPIFGILEIGCWMCGYDDFFLKMILDPDFVRKFFEKILDYQKKVIEIYYGAIGEYIHFTTSGDDFGTQTGPFISPVMFEKLIKPYFKERIDYTHTFTKANFFHHTCGSVYPLIPHLIDIGVDILNPIQPGAKDMEPHKLKQAFGNRITFNGGVDTQHILPKGTAEDVKREVYRVLGVFSRNGGYIFAPAHNIQPDVPAENIITMYKAAHEYFEMGGKA